MASERCRHVVQVAAFGCAAAELEQERIDRPDSGFEHADAGGSPSARAAKRAAKIPLLVSCATFTHTGPRTRGGGHMIRIRTR
mgnify:FL=1|jgi:hypothetical protein